MQEVLIRTDDEVVIGFRNSNGDVEYTTYRAEDGGVIDSECSDLGGILADNSDITEYDEYILVNPITCINDAALKETMIEDFQNYSECSEDEAKAMVEENGEWIVDQMWEMYTERLSGIIEYEKGKNNEL